MFVQAKADAFVQYDELAQKMCETTISLALYPVARTPSLTSSFLTLREVTKKYFAIFNNLLYPEEDFEQELSGMALEPPDIGETADKVGTCTSSDTMLDQHVYELFNTNGFPPDPAVSRYCRKAILVGKRLGHPSPDAAHFASRTFAEHFANIVAGISFAYAFCNAEHGVGSLPLSDTGASSFPLLNVCSEWAKAKLQTSDVPPDILPFLDPYGKLPQPHANECRPRFSVSAIPVIHQANGSKRRKRRWAIDLRAWPSPLTTPDWPARLI